MSDTPTPSQAAEKAIREALEAGPTLGQWSIMKSYGSGARCSVKAGLARIAVPSVTNLNWEANAALIAACNPEAMTALLSQLAEMRAEVERLREQEARTARNRDMWKGQCERQAEAITALRGQRVVLFDLLRESVGPLEVSAAIIESDDGEQMEELISKIKRALNAFSSAAIDAALAADGKDGAR